MLVPIAKTYLVAADMNVLSGKRSHHFGQYVLQKGHALRPGNAKYAAGITGHAQTIGTVGAVGAIVVGRIARELWIRRQWRGGVARHLDFRHNGDMPLGRVGHNLANILLGIITAVEADVAPRRARTRVQPEHGIGAPGA